MGTEICLQFGKHIINLALGEQRNPITSYKGLVRPGLLKLRRIA